MKQRPICPRCGQPAFQFESPNGLKSRCEPCGLWSKGNRPLRDAEEHRARFELRRARCNAHAAFDRLWDEGHMDREEAYVRLAQELGMDRDACHMSLMDVETARRVPPAVKAIRVSLRGVMAS